MVVGVLVLYLGNFTKSNFNNLKALPHCSVHLKTAPFLSIVLRHTVTSTKKGDELPVECN